MVKDSKRGTQEICSFFKLNKVSFEDYVLIATLVEGNILFNYMINS